MNQVKSAFIDYYTRTPLSLALERVQEVQIFQEMILESPVLDLGCGDGIFARNAFQSQIDVGLDLNAGELRVAESTFCYKQLVLADARKLPFESGTFQTVVSNSVMEHMSQLEDILAEVNRVLRINGALIVTIPTERFEKNSSIYRVLSLLRFEDFSRRFGKFYNVFWRHKNVYTKEGWENLFRAAGFRVIESFNYNSRNQTLVNDVLAWTAVLGWLSKRILNRWTLNTWLRRNVFSPILYRVFIRQIKLKKHPEGTLIYFHLVKNEN